MSGTEKTQTVLFLSPESPYPLHGGGQYRTASLIHYFAAFAQVDLILFSESGKPALLPPGLIRKQTVIPLPRHGKGMLERYARNARRAVLGVPPLIDRLKGLSAEIEEAIGEERYGTGVVEHFWLAPYADLMRGRCARTILDLHNVESALHQTCADRGDGLVAAGHRRFAEASRKMEAAYLPRFSDVLTASELDRERALSIAPGAKVSVYPNALPFLPSPEAENALAESAGPGKIVFSGNFEYHPNIDAVRFLTQEIWPAVSAKHPDIRLRLVGRGDRFIRHLLPQDNRIEVSGEVPDALREIGAAKLVIAPLRMGSGTRIKILEAWAANRPVVATELAAEGLAAEHGKNILLANTPADFSGSILQLLSDIVSRHRLASEGRCTFERNYTWKVAWAALDACLQVTRSEQVNRYTGSV